MSRPIAIKPLDNYRLWVKFSDGVEGIADLSDLAGKGVFAFWNDHRAFEKVRIGSSGEIVWSDQVDLCPDSIYLKVTGKQPEEIFPKLREMMQYA